ncbi:hypothetical protein [Micromonospora aurantiaca (nom. illeg.)]|uniref:hypothetical protein n=1 Tax=Micromonospora aurantiaca (nom. illeg.) TaxID=47850 RepID=UPI00165756C7|nr:hypothetical protein [Micromonospora aurantiaca]MBC9001740.1 hypothetical protein [Micromonospora aurantiaca]
MPEQSGDAPLTGDYELVAIPVRYLPHVAQLLADLQASERPAPALRTRPTPDTTTAPWPLDDLRQLIGERSDTGRTVVAVMDALAARPRTPMTVPELAAVTGIPRERIVGALAGLTRLLKAHFDFPRLGLPFHKVIRLADGRRKEACYILPEEHAVRWRQARRP